jgi:hypothetical protein
MVIATIRVILLYIKTMVVVLSELLLLLLLKYLLTTTFDVSSSQEKLKLGSAAWRGVAV